MLLMVDYLTTSANVSTKLIPSSCSNLRATSLAFSSSTCPLDPTFDLKIGVFPTCQLSARSNFELLSPSLGLSLFPILCVELPDQRFRVQILRFLLSVGSKTLYAFECSS